MLAIVYALVEAYIVLSQRGTDAMTPQRTPFSLHERATYNQHHSHCDLSARVRGGPALQ